MAWTYNGLTGYAAVKAADAALSPAIADPAAAAAALNAQTVSVVVDMATADARAVLLVSGEWFGIKQLGKQSVSGTSPPTAMDQAIAAANIAVDTLTLTTVLHVSDAPTWAKVQQLAGGLITAGVLSQASLDTWTAMRTKTQPAWTPPLSAGDLQTARNQP